MLRSFRLRITVWYLLFISALFAAFSVFVYGTLAGALRNRLDETLAAECRTAAALFLSELQELRGDPQAAAVETIAELRVAGVAISIFEGERLLSANTKPAGAGLRAARETVGYGGRRFRVVAECSTDSIAADLAMVRRALYFGLPLVFLAAGAGGYWLASRSVRPLQAMAEQARSITDRSLGTRLEIGSSTEELAALAATFNELLSRLDTSFETMRRFIADASHELRTPVAVIRGEADVTLGKERGPAEYRQSLAVIHEESKRLSRLVDDLLNLARADAGHVRLQTGELYLNDLLSECCRAVQTLAAAKDIALECRAGEDAAYCGDEELLRRMVLNLLDNAIRYTRGGGRVAVTLERGDSALRIRVSDTGIGIEPDAVPHVFERFYHRQEGGLGLGLAIVKWIAESHRGRVELATAPGRGSEFTVTLPQ